MSAKVDWLGEMTESNQNQGDNGFENDIPLLKWSHSKMSECKIARFFRFENIMIIFYIFKCLKMESTLKMLENGQKMSEKSYDIKFSYRYILDVMNQNAKENTDFSKLENREN